jgi:hypothetical protein
MAKKRASRRAKKPELKAQDLVTGSPEFGRPELSPVANQAAEQIAARPRKSSVAISSMPAQARPDLIYSATVEQKGLVAETGAYTVAGQQIRVAIVLQADALLLQIDEKLKELEKSRSNSEIAKFATVRELIAKLRGASIDPVDTGRKETAAAKSLIECLRDFWQEDHVNILRSTFKIGMFASCLALCSLANPTAVIVSGALAGGKEVADVLKAYFSQSSSET